MVAASSAASSVADIEAEAAPSKKVHMPNGTACKYCLRADTSHNPLIMMRYKQPTLPWRRESGCECSICPAAVKQSKEYKGV